MTSYRCSLTSSSPSLADVRWATAWNAADRVICVVGLGDRLRKRVAGDHVQRRVEQQQEAGATGIDHPPP